MDLETRINKITQVLNSSKEPLSAKEISTKYVENSTSSDWLSTNHILHVMSIFGLVTRHVKNMGKATRNTYEKIK